MSITRPPAALRLKSLDGTPIDGVMLGLRRLTAAVPPGAALQARMVGLLSAGALLAAPAGAQAATYCVPDASAAASCDATHPTLQAAFDAADATPDDDEIALAEGTLAGANLQQSGTGGALLVSGAAGTGWPTTQLSGTGQVLRIAGSSVVVERVEVFREGGSDGAVQVEGGELRDAGVRGSGADSGVLSWENLLPEVELVGGTLRRTEVRTRSQVGVLISPPRSGAVSTISNSIIALVGTKRFLGVAAFPLQESGPGLDDGHVAAVVTDTTVVGTNPDAVADGIAAVAGLDERSPSDPEDPAISTVTVSGLAARGFASAVCTDGYSSASVSYSAAASGFAPQVCDPGPDETPLPAGTLAQGSGNVVANPQFANFPSNLTPATSGNLHDAGDPVAPLAPDTLDVWGRARQDGLARDIGAVEQDGTAARQAPPDPDAPDDGGTTPPPGDGDTTVPPDDGGGTTTPPGDGSTLPPSDGGGEFWAPSLPGAPYVPIVPGTPPAGDDDGAITQSVMAMAFKGKLKRAKKANKRAFVVLKKAPKSKRAPVLRIVTSSPMSLRATLSKRVVVKRKGKKKATYKRVKGAELLRATTSRTMLLKPTGSWKRKRLSKGLYQLTVTRSGVKPRTVRFRIS